MKLFSMLDIPRKKMISYSDILHFGLRKLFVNDKPLRGGLRPSLTKSLLRPFFNYVRITWSNNSIGDFALAKS